MSRPKTKDRDPNYDEKVARNLARRKWEINNPEKWEEQKRNQRFKRRYGITSKEYDTLLLNQKGTCAICNKLPQGLHSSGRGKVLHVDHDHTTGKIRALLCDKCNRGLGYFSDNPELLIKASEYINAHSSS